MSIAIPRWLAPWLVGAGLMGLGLSLVTAIRAYVQLQRAEYYVIREAARRTAVRTTLLIPLLALLTIGLVLIPRQALTPDAPPALATVTPSQSPTPIPTRVTSTSTATVTPTVPQPTATEPFIPTSTPQATLPVTFTAPLSGAIPPPADARIEFWTLAQGVDENNQPLGPSSQFLEGTERIYLFFRYDGLLSNAPWTTVWYHNGELLRGGTDLWESRLPRGERYVYLSLANGYAAGEYEVQVWLGDRLQIRAFFSVAKTEE